MSTQTAVYKDELQKVSFWKFFQEPWTNLHVATIKVLSKFNLSLTSNQNLCICSGHNIIFLCVPRRSLTFRNIQPLSVISYVMMAQMFLAQTHIISFFINTPNHMHALTAAICCCLLSGLWSEEFTGLCELQMWPREWARRLNMYRLTALILTSV